MVIVEDRKVPILTVDAKKDGQITIKQMRLYDDDGTMIADISDAKFWVYDPLRRERKDVSTLTLFTRRGDEALFLQYANKNALVVRGRFGSGVSRTIIDNESLSGPGIVTGGCFGDMLKAAITIS